MACRTATRWATRFAINGRMLGHGEPIRVQTGQRVLLHVLNGSATEIRSLALPGHTFTVVALDGNPVPNPAPVPVLWLGAAERISAIVQMTNPGVWVLGRSRRRRPAATAWVLWSNTPAAAVIRNGPPPPPFKWDYRQFATPGATAPAAPDHTIEMLIAKRNAADNGFNVWTINGKPFAMDSQSTRLRPPAGQALPAAVAQRQRRHPPHPPAPAHLRDHPRRRHTHRRADKDVAMLGGYQTWTSTSSPTNPACRCFTATNNYTWTTDLWRCCAPPNQAPTMTSKTTLRQGFLDCALVVRRADPRTAHQPGEAILVVDYRVLSRPP